jgi:uncharacterized phage protein (TIGR02220 family)
MKNEITKNFTITPNELINDESINPIARFLFVWLCSKPANWKFHNSVIEKSMNFKKDSRLKYMNELREKGWLTLKQVMNEDGTFGPNEIHLNPSPVFPATVEPSSDLSVAGNIRDGKNRPHSKTNKSNKTKKSNKKEMSLFSENEIQSIPKEVIGILNTLKPSKKPFEFTASNIKLIEARIKEGFKIHDFKAVIIYKIAEWKDNDKMKKYIRPETLFGTKFNSYLVEANEKGSGDGSTNFEFNPTQKAQLA